VNEPISEGAAQTAVESQEAPRGALANQLVTLALNTGVELFHDERGEPYAVLPLKTGRAIVAIGGRDFERWLGHLAWQQLGRALNREALVSARHVLASKALFEGQEHPLHVRVAVSEGAIWIDLDGRRAIRVLPGHWKIVAEPPILFRHFPHQRPLPTPREGGDPWRLLRFVNLHNRADELMLLCHLVAAFVPDIPVAILITHGVQGAAKTTLLKLVKRLLDPSAVSVLGGARSLDEYALLAFQHRILFFDNQTSLPLWFSDALCRTVTGEGYARRTLYTDTDAIAFDYRRIVGISGIHNVADRADLLDRAVILSLAPISPEQRREERELWAEFEGEAGSILGGLLDALAAAMAILPGLQLLRKPRMADYAHWGAAAAAALGASAEDFLAAYALNVGRQNEAAIEGSPVAQAVLALVASQPQWAGTPGELLEQLQTVAEQKRIDIASKHWPTNPVWLTRRLREAQANLLAMGVSIADTRSGQHRVLRLRQSAQNTVITVIPRPDGPRPPDSVTLRPSAGSDTVIASVTANPLSDQTHDSSDGSDSKHAGEGGAIRGVHEPVRRLPAARVEPQPCRGFDPRPRGQWGGGEGLA